MDGLGVITVFIAFTISKKSVSHGATYNRRIVRICGQDVFSALVIGVFDHFEQALRLRLAVDDRRAQHLAQPGQHAVSRCAQWRRCPPNC